MRIRTLSPHLILATAALALLAACAVEEPPARPQGSSTTTEDSQQGQLPDLTPQASAPQVRNPTEVAADAVQTGSALDARGAASEARPVYALTDTVHASASIRDVDPGSTLSVYWTFEDGLTHKEETVPVPAGEYASFRFSQADGMRPGQYNVQIDAGFMPIGIAEFRVE